MTTAQATRRQESSSSREGLVSKEFHRGRLQPAFSGLTNRPEAPEPTHRASGYGASGTRFLRNSQAQSSPLQSKAAATD